MEAFPTRGWNLILPGCGGTSTLSPGATLASCWLHELWPISDQRMGVGFHTVRGDIHQENQFVPEMLNLQIYGGLYDPGMGYYPPRAQRDLNIGPRGNSRRALTPGEVSAPYGAVSTRGGHCFRPRVVGVVLEVWKTSCSRGGTLSSPSAADSRSYRLSAIKRYGRDFYIVQVGVDTRGAVFIPSWSEL